MKGKQDFQCGETIVCGYREGPSRLQPSAANLSIAISMRVQLSCRTIRLSVFHTTGMWVSGRGRIGKILWKNWPPATGWRCSAAVPMLHVL